MPRRRTDRRYGLFLAIALVPSTLAIPDGLSETLGASDPAALAIAPAPADTLEPQLVALLYLRRAGAADSTAAELYPVALLTPDTILEARVFAPDPYAGPGYAPRYPAPPADSPTVLDSIRELTVYHEGQAVGRFLVTRTISAEYTCTAVRVGTGHHEGLEEPDAFGEDNPRVDLYVAGDHAYGLSYFLALGIPVEQPVFARDTLEHPNVARRLRREIERIARDSLDGFHLEGWPGAEISRGSPALRSFALYDLDLDGRFEAVGRMGFVMEHDATDPAVTHPFVETFDVAFTIWVSEGSGRELLLLLAERHVVPGGSWGEGLELVEVMDLTGDGRAELFYELSGWEGNDYLIYRYDRESGDPALRKVFQGSGYGC